MNGKGDPVQGKNVPGHGPKSVVRDQRNDYVKRIIDVVLVPRSAKDPEIKMLVRQRIDMLTA